jgi:hypothetical protein
VAWEGFYLALHMVSPELTHSSVTVLVFAVMRSDIEYLLRASLLPR